MPAVDSHAHVFSRECRVAADARYRPGYFALARDWTVLWPDAQISHGVLVQPSFLGRDNRYLLQQLGSSADQMRGVVVTGPGTDRAILSAWSEAGVRGIRLNLIGASDFGVYARPEWQSLFARIADLGWHLEIQCEGERVSSLLSVLGAVPLALVFDHFGLPDPKADGCAGASAILRAAQSRPVYVKLSAPYRLRGADPRSYAARYLAELGAEHLLWGSDWPWTNHEAGRCYRECRSWLDSWVPSAAARQAILWETPRALYGFPYEHPGNPAA